MGLFGFGKVSEATVRVNYDGKNAEKGLGGLKKAVAGVITAAIMKETIQYTYELGKLGAQANSVQKNFENFAKRSGKSTDEMMQKLRTATLGMVNDMELQQRAMQAMVAGVKFDDIITSMEYVTKFASATGTDVSQKMMTVMTGLARGSAQFLDDVGIQVIGSKDVVNDAMIQMKEKMGQFTTSEEDAAVQAEQLKAEMQNLKIELGQKVQPVFVGFLNIANRALTEWKQIFSDIGDFMSKVGLIQKKTQQERINTTIQEVQELQKLRKEQEMIRDTQLAMQAQGGIYFSQEALDQALSNIEAINEEIKSVDKNFRKVGSGTGLPIPGTTMAKKESDSGGKKRAQAERNAMQKIREQMAQDAQAHWEFEEKRREEVLADIENNYVLLTDAQKIYEGSRIELMEDSAEKEKATIKARFDELHMVYAGNSDALKLIKEAEINEIKLMEQQRREEDIQEERKLKEEKTKLAQEGLSSYSSINQGIMSIINIRTSKEIANLKKLGLEEEEFAKRKEEIMQASAQKQRTFARIQQGIAIAEATVNVYKAASGVFSQTFGGVISRSLAMAAAIGQGLVTVSQIQAQHFETGRIGDVSRDRKRDSVFAMLGPGESVISAPQTAIHEDTLRAIQDNTANTAAGMANMPGGNIVNNFYGISTEQMLEAQVNIHRKNRVGRRI